MGKGDQLYDDRWNTKFLMVTQHAIMYTEYCPREIYIMLPHLKKRNKRWVKTVQLTKGL